MSAVKVIYDDTCSFCNASRKEYSGIVPADREIDFIPASSKSADIILKEYGFSGAHKDSVIYIKHSKVYQRSNAIIEMIRDCGGVYKMIVIFKLVPRSIRDAVYSFLAMNRHRIFGRNHNCEIKNS